MKMEHYPELGYRRNKRRMKLQLYNLFLEKREVNKVMSEISTQKYKGLIASALKKVQKQVQPTLTVDNDALYYLEDLIIQLLYQLCSSQPHTVPDMEEKIEKSLPSQIKDWALDSAQAAIEKGKKKTLTLSVDKIQPFIQKEVLGYRIDIQLAKYIVAVLEYISADILKLAGNYVKNIRHTEITTQDVKVAIYADSVLLSMFHNEDLENAMEPVLQPFSKRGSLSYIEVLKDFMLAEEQYLRELNLIIKIFYEPMKQADEYFSEDDLETIFSNMFDIHEVTLQFYAMVETAFEMVGPGKDPLIGDIFEEMAEAAEFENYDTYIYDQVQQEEEETIGTYRRIKEMLDDPANREFFKKKGLYDAFRYILPKLLYRPIYHCSDYFEYIRLLMCTSPDGADREKLDETLSALLPLQSTIERICSTPPLKRTPEDKVFYQRSMGTAVPNSVSKIMSIQDSIEGWEGKAINQISSLLLKEGILIKPAQDGKKATERKTFLFDNLLVCTKQNVRPGFFQAEFRLKEKIFLRKAEIRDIEDTDELQNAFEIGQPNNETIVFCCKDDLEKFEWMSFLMTLQHRSTLDRMLDVILQDEEQGIELYTPNPDDYIFAEEDSPENIVFEDSLEDESKIIKGGTLYKLIERLTYHKYSDPTFIRVFLTTYRSFSEPVELLDLLIKRYDIPEPRQSNERSPGTVTREEYKRFKKEYGYPVQLRVLNVLRHWVDHHFYDFQREESLLGTLQKFLSRVVRSKNARKWVESIEKIVNRRLEIVSVAETFTFSSPPPPVEWHLATTYEKFNLLTLHPLEIGRQITIMQSEMFRSIKPSELVGTVWMGKEREKLSPNALGMIRLSTLLTYWYEKSVCEAENFEERVAIFTRIVDILMVFNELNNFNGMMEIVGALNSSPVHRLKLTKDELTPKRQQALQEAIDLTMDGHNMKYKEKLRSINPPCVPFLGMYLSQILKAEEGNPDFLVNTPEEESLINFSKRRRVADITGEIQKYQNMPYNLTPQPLIRQYLEELDPREGRTDTELENYLYELSLQIEPRNAKQPPKFSRKTDIQLKSPGIKPAQKGQTTTRRTSGLKSQSESFDYSSGRRPPSPTPSTASFLSTFTISEDISDEDTELTDDVLPPPALLPRRPNKPKHMPRSASVDVRPTTSPPELPPRTVKTPGYKPEPVFEAIFERDTNIQEIAARYYNVTPDSQDRLDGRPETLPRREPPSLPPRNTQSNIDSRSPVGQTFDDSQNAPTLPSRTLKPDR